MTRTVTVVERQAPPRERSAPVRSSRGSATRSGYSACDRNIRVWTATTSCEFAQNAFWHYWTSGRAEVIRPYSPAVRSAFVTTCRVASQEVRCTTDDGGKAIFPVAAVDAYSQAQADAYAAGHDLGPDPYEDPALHAQDGAADEGGDLDDGACAAGYDPCIPPYPPDLDCADVGPVTVTGSDPHGLDADGDGRGCE